MLTVGWIRHPVLTISMQIAGSTGVLSKKPWTRNIPIPLPLRSAGIVLGTTEFVREIEETHLGQRKAHRDLPGLRQISGRWSIEAILAEVHKGVPGDERLRKKISIYLCHHYSGARLREIGACFGIGESAVSQESRRFKRKLEKNGDLKKMVEQIRERLRGVNM